MEKSRMEDGREKLRSSLSEAMCLVESREAKEMADMESHQFSDEFEQKMEDLMARFPKRRSKARLLLRYMPVAIAVIIFIGNVLVYTTVKTEATWFGLDIVKWLEEFFQVDAGDGWRKDDSVLFEEAQIGYLPEGFKKVAEHISFSGVYYKYQNSEGKYINIQVVRDKGMLTSDGTEVLMDEGINADGYDYQYVQKKEKGEDALIWSNEKGIYYHLTSTLAIEEMIRVMNEITY